MIEALPNSIEAIAYLAMFRMVELVSTPLSDFVGDLELLHRCPAYQASARD